MYFDADEFCATQRKVAAKKKEYAKRSQVAQETCSREADLTGLVSAVHCWLFELLSVQEPTAVLQSAMVNGSFRRADPPPFPTFVARSMERLASWVISSSNEHACGTTDKPNLGPVPANRNQR